MIFRIKSDFNIAFNIEDRLYIGATLGLYDVLYDRYSSYLGMLDEEGKYR
mgnify:CR=1 FL=1